MWLGLADRNDGARVREGTPCEAVQGGLGWAQPGQGLLSCAMAPFLILSNQIK